MTPNNRKNTTMTTTETPINFTDYTVTISDDPAYYNLVRDQVFAKERTQEIVSDVTSLIERHYPGINVVADAAAPCWTHNGPALVTHTVAHA